MINFRSLTIRNILSYGNVPTTIVFDAAPSTMIIGVNGGGKSGSTIDSLFFALFGKPYRNIKKDQLINSINKKNSSVDLRFDVDGKNYRIFRSQKPSKFEIYLDDVLIDQEAAVKDYQKYLETFILKLNAKTLAQILVLSSAAFVPFMKLAAAPRREVVEDILDIGVFSSMNKLLKERVSETKSELIVTETKLNASKNEAIAQKKLIDLLSSNKDKQILEIDSEIASVVEESKTFLKERSDLTIELESVVQVAEPDYVGFDSWKTERQLLVRENSTNQNQIDNVAELHTCSTCSQEVSDEHKEAVRVDLFAKIAKNSSIIQELDSKISSFKQVDAEFQAFEVNQSSIKYKINEINRSLVECKNSIEKLKAKKIALETDSGDITSETETLKEIGRTGIQLMKRKEELLQEKSLQDVSLALLKDSGIKAAVVKEYLPVLNKLINKYLGKFNFFVDFELDENFNETIRSRGRDEFSYESFSEGEKRKIDVSILLAFRDIAALKNSAKINILVCDEVDGGLDLEGKEAFVELMTTMKIHTFVISHVLAGTPLADAFSSFIEVKKVGDFSVMERVET